MLSVGALIPNFFVPPHERKADPIPRRPELSLNTRIKPRELHVRKLAFYNWITEN